MYYEILDKKRREILPLFKGFKKDFYLGGGTALALHLGHRDSIDFDFFNPREINTETLFLKLKQIFSGYQIKKIQEEENTLTVILDNNIKVSFFTYNYPLIKKLISEKNLNLASIEDIACMKLSAIISRATNKDYIDLYFIIKKAGSLDKLLTLASKKFKEIDTNLILKSLIYFDDIEMEPIIFKRGQKVEFLKIKQFLVKEVKALEKSKKT